MLNLSKLALEIAMGIVADFFPGGSSNPHRQGAKGKPTALQSAAEAFTAKARSSPRERIPFRIPFLKSAPSVDTFFDSSTDFADFRRGRKHKAIHREDGKISKEINGGK